MNSIFTEENLLAFTTAARFGSFSKAAEELGLTTPPLATPLNVWRRGWMWCCSLAVPAALS